MRTCPYLPNNIDSATDSQKEYSKSVSIGRTWIVSPSIVADSTSPFRVKWGCA